MLDFLSSEIGIRLVSFVGILGVMSLWEVFAPRRSPLGKKTLRWSSNFCLVFINSILMRLIAPLGAVGVAQFAESRGWGLLNQLTLPSVISTVLAFVVLDFAIYLQHRMFHAIPILWRSHMVHHADLDCDVSTGLRFHTFEIVISFVIKSSVVILLGASPLAVVIFEVVLNGTAMFNHSNIRIPRPLDKLLRLILVTPDMHRVHHSVDCAETNSNFGFNLPWWDFLFRTYRSQPAEGHEEMHIGLPRFRHASVQQLCMMLTMPFVTKSVATTEDSQKIDSEQIQPNAVTQVRRTIADNF